MRRIQWHLRIHPKLDCPTIRALPQVSICQASHSSSQGSWPLLWLLDKILASIWSSKILQEFNHYKTGFINDREKTKHLLGSTTQYSTFDIALFQFSASARLIWWFREINVIFKVLIVLLFIVFLPLLILSIIFLQWNPCWLLRNKV